MVFIELFQPICSFSFTPRPCLEGPGPSHSCIFLELYGLVNWLACLPSSPQALRVQLSPPPWGSNHTFTYFQNYVDASCLLLFPLWFYLSLWVSPIFIPYCLFRDFERAWIETQSVMLNQRFYNAILILPCFPLVHTSLVVKHVKATSGSH